VYIMHNTYVARGDGEGAGFELREPAKHSAVTLLNNIIIAGSGIAWAYISPAVQLLEAPLELTADYNTYFTESDVFGTRRGSNPTMWFNDLVELQSALPYEAHSMQYRVQFADGDSGSYIPIAGSPVIDAGSVIPGLNNDNYYGDRPDMGAVETKWIVDVRDDSNDERPRVHPNPTQAFITVRGDFTVHGDFESGAIEWSIADLTGNTVLRGTSKALNSSLSIDMSVLPIGVYTLVLDQTTRVQSLHVVKY